MLGQFFVGVRCEGGQAQCQGRQKIHTAQVIQCSTVKVCFSPDENEVELQAQLQELAKEIVVGLSVLEPKQSENLLGSFVSTLFLSVAEESRREDRRQKQAEGIAAARARGVRFGPSPKPLPEHFAENYEAWANGAVTMTQAAANCGISRKAFSRAIDRMKRLEDCAV